MLIEIDDKMLNWLIKAREAKNRGFHEWTINQLLSQAIYEFYDRYGK